MSKQYYVMIISQTNLVCLFWKFCYKSCKFLAICRTQIREQMSGPDLHVFTLKFLALKKLVFPP